MEIRLVEPLEPDYPEALRALEAPPALEWAGPKLSGAILAIVGSRRATPEALRFARELAAWAAKQDVLVLSGGALGIDGAAHEGALEASGRTAAVLVAPLERPAPARHRSLFRRMLDEGGSLLASRDLPRSKGAFVERNLFVAALADHVVVVQAGARSGSLQTGRLALRLGRPLWSVPGAPWSPLAEGCLDLLKQGARLLRGPEDLADALGLAAPRARRELCPRRAWLRSQGQAFPEDMAQALGLDAGEVLRWASREEILGRLKRTTGGQLRLAQS
ncbi:MAG: DNA-processing protein DprA [Myxococcota bacterium]